jgi:hypothetical protein
MSTLFDAEEARDEALARAAFGAGDWIGRARVAVERVAVTRFDFTSDEVWDLLGEDRPDEPRALGSVMKAMARDGLIRQTGQYRKSGRVDCHARPVAVWRIVL